MNRTEFENLKFFLQLSLPSFFRETRFDDSKPFWKKKSNVYMTSKVRGVDGNVPLQCPMIAINKGHLVCLAGFEKVQLGLRASPQRWHRTCRRNQEQRVEAFEGQDTSP
jgi:hypothetical protein